MLGEHHVRRGPVTKSPNLWISGPKVTFAQRRVCERVCYTACIQTVQKLAARATTDVEQ